MKIAFTAKFKQSLCVFIFAVFLLWLSLFITGRPYGTEAVAQTPTRGTWNENVFTSEYLGLQITVPPSPWRAFSTAEIATLHGLTAAQIGTEPSIPHELWNNPGIITDLYLHHTETAASIELTFQKIPQHAYNFSLYEHLRHYGEIEMAQAAGMRLESSFEITGTTTLAGIDWLTKRSEFAISGSAPVVTVHLTSQNGGYLRCLKFVVDDDYEFQEILLWFEP